jgi:hypothetical protein
MYKITNLFYDFANLIRINSSIQSTFHLEDKK